MVFVPVFSVWYKRKRHIISPREYTDMPTSLLTFELMTSSFHQRSTHTYLTGLILKDYVFHIWNIYVSTWTQVLVLINTGFLFWMNRRLFNRSWWHEQKNNCFIYQNHISDIFNKFSWKKKYPSKLFHSVPSQVQRVWQNCPYYENGHGVLQERPTNPTGHS